MSSVDNASRGIPVPVVELEDGKAEPMGGGVFVVMQRDATAKGKAWQNVVLTRGDLEAMLAAA